MNGDNMIFEFEEAEIQYIYDNLRKIPLVFNEVHPILFKIETQFNKNKTASANSEINEKVE